MAKLICPSCGSEGSTDNPLCPRCVLPYQPQEDKPSTEHSDGIECTDADCEHRGILPETPCAHCGLSAPPPPRPGPRPIREPARLRFPWGDEEVPASGRLLVGREGSPLAGRLAAYTNVSRKHAEISLVGRELVVIDLNSVNGTFVNCERLPPMSPHPLRDGDELRFAAGLRAVIKLRTS